jgi:hypothetical protein
MAFPRKKPHKLLDIVISQIDTHDLAGGTVLRKRMEDQSCGFVVGGHDGCFLIIHLVDVDLAL